MTFLNLVCGKWMVQLFWSSIFLYNKVVYTSDIDEYVQEWVLRVRQGEKCMKRRQIQIFMVNGGDNFFF